MQKVSKENAEKLKHEEAAFLQHMYETYGIAYIFAAGKAIAREIE